MIQRALQQHRRFHLLIFCHQQCNCIAQNILCYCLLLYFDSFVIVHVFVKNAQQFSLMIAAKLVIIGFCVEIDGCLSNRPFV